MMKIGRFLDGMASAGDLFGVRRDPEIETLGETSDAEALLGDWQTIGHDLAESVDPVQRELEAVAR